MENGTLERSLKELEISKETLLKKKIQRKMEMLMIMMEKMMTKRIVMRTRMMMKKMVTLIWTQNKKVKMI